MKDILVVEDNQELGELLCDFLKAEGYGVQLAASGEEAADYLEREEVRLVVLDIMLPGMDGFDLCRQIRKENSVPIIMVSARGSKEDKLNGLLQGADDYIEKPYDIDILIAKINGIFKRRYETSIIQAGEVKIDKNKRKAFLIKDENPGRELTLTVKEYDLLLLFAENKGKALTKEFLFNKVWGFDSFSEPQTLTVHIKWLREKIEKDPGKPRHIQTVWGVGYRFE